MTFQKLITSRRFWLTLLDVIMSSIVMVIGVVKPDWQKMTTALVALWQPVIITIIVAYTVDNAQETKANALTSVATTSANAITSTQPQRDC